MEAVRGAALGRARRLATTLLVATRHPHAGTAAGAAAAFALAAGTPGLGETTAAYAAAGAAAGLWARLRPRSAPLVAGMLAAAAAACGVVTAGTETARCDGHPTRVGSRPAGGARRRAAASG